jgi:hypothetical protein
MKSTAEPRKPPPLRKPTLRVPRVPRKPLAVLAPAPDPLDESLYPPTFEGENLEEVRQLRKALGAARKKEMARFDAIYDINYFFTVIFEDAAQAAAFLTAMGYPRHLERTFIDGRLLADHICLALPKATANVYDVGRKPRLQPKAKEK